MNILCRGVEFCCGKCQKLFVETIAVDGKGELSSKLDRLIKYILTLETYCGTCRGITWHVKKLK